MNVFCFIQNKPLVKSVKFFVALRVFTKKVLICFFINTYMTVTRTTRMDNWQKIDCIILKILHIRLMSL